MYAIYLVERHALLRGRVVGRQARHIAIGLVDYIYTFAIGADPYPAVGSLVQGDGYHGVVAVAAEKVPPRACFSVEERHAAVGAEPIVAVGVFGHGVDGARRQRLRVERLMNKQFDSIAESRSVVQAACRCGHPYSAVAVDEQVGYVICRDASGHVGVGIVVGGYRCGNRVDCVDAGSVDTGKQISVRREGDGAHGFVGHSGHLAGVAAVAARHPQPVVGGAGKDARRGDAHRLGVERRVEQLPEFCLLVAIGHCRGEDAFFGAGNQGAAG